MSRQRLFLLLSLAVFLLFAISPGARDGQVIVVDEAWANTVARSYQRRSGESLTAESFQALLTEKIREERLYRESLARGFDQGDHVVRRWLAQKMLFLQEEQVAPPQPSELRSFYEGRKEDYMSPSLYSFTHIYLGTDKGVYERAKRLLPLPDRPLSEEEAQRLSLRFHLPLKLERVTLVEIARRYGTQMERHVREAPLGTWTEPILSGYGYHLLRVAEYEKGQVQSFEEVLPKVQGDYRVYRREQSRGRLLHDLAARYQVVYQPSLSELMREFSSHRN